MSKMRWYESDVPQYVDEQGHSEHFTLKAGKRSTASDLQAAVAMLRRLEWGGRSDDGMYVYCSICGNPSKEHRPNCELDALLKRLSEKG